VKTSEREKEEKKIEEEVEAKEKKKRSKLKGKGQPIDPPGMSKQVAEGLVSLEERVEQLREKMQDVMGNGHQFNLISEQYGRTIGDEEEHTRVVLLEAGEGLVERMQQGIKEYKVLASQVSL